MYGIYGELRAIWLENYNLEEYIEVLLNVEFEDDDALYTSDNSKLYTINNSLLVTTEE